MPFLPTPERHCSCLRKLSQLSTVSEHGKGFSGKSVLYYARIERGGDNKIRGHAYSKVHRAQGSVNHKNVWWRPKGTAARIYSNSRITLTNVVRLPAVSYVGYIPRLSAERTTALSNPDQVCETNRLKGVLATLLATIVSVPLTEDAGKQRRGVISGRWDTALGKV